MIKPEKFYMELRDAVKCQSEERVNIIFDIIIKDLTVQRDMLLAVIRQKNIDLLDSMLRNEHELQ